MQIMQTTTEEIGNSSSNNISTGSHLPLDRLLQCLEDAKSHQFYELYGRNDQVQQIHDIYEHVKTTQMSQVILISGVTGIGKTGLARSIQQKNNIDMTKVKINNNENPTIRNSSTSNITTESILNSNHNNDSCLSNGYFVVGKYDQLQRPEPHGALVEVCTQFITQIIHRGYTDLFCTALANHGIDYNRGGHDFIEMIPSLRQVIPIPNAGVEKKKKNADDQKSDSDNGTISLISTTDVVSTHGLSTNRWKDLFRLFFRAVSSMHYNMNSTSNSSSSSTIGNGNGNNIHPIVVLIEDLHWADESSIDVLQTLFQDTANHGTLFIGTCRTESGGSNTLALQQCIMRQKQNDVAITHIALGPVPIDAIVRMITNVLSVEEVQAVPLASIFYNWTKGNVFLLWKCITILHFKNLLRIDPESGQFIWEIDEIDIEMHAIRDMMKYKIGLLPESSKENIKVAACLGSKLNEDILVRLFSGKEAAVSAFINDTAAVHLIAYDKNREAWCFSHDYVQEKVYEFIPSSERHVYHYRIGRKLWREFAMDELTDFLFLVVGQLLLGAECIKDRREGVAVAKLCLGAGVRAFQLSNFQSSYKYLKCGINLLDDNAWDDEYDIMMKLHSTSAEVANALGIFVDVHTLVTESLKRSKSYEDTYRARATRVQALGRCGKLEEAIQSGMDILTDLGEKIPTNQHPIRSLLELSLLRRRIRGKTNEMIMRLPILTDPMKLAAMEIMNLIFLYTAIVKPELTPLIGCRMVRISLDHGLSALSCIGFAIFAASVSGVGQAFNEANRLGMLGFSLLQKFNAKPWLARFSDVYFDLVFGWVRPFGDCRVPLMDAYNAGLQSGDTEFALSCALSPIFTEFGIRPIPEQQHEIGILRERIDLYGLKNLASLIIPVTHLLIDLSRHYGGDINEIKRMIVNDEGMYDVEANHLLVKWKYAHRAFKFYLFGFYDEAATNARACDTLAGAFYGPCRGAFIAILCGLVDVANARAKKYKQAYYAKKFSKLLLRWATDGEPRNFIGKHFLLEAELAALAGKKALSYRHYISAIGACREGKFLLFTAIAYERAARSLLEWGQNDLAGHYFQEAIALHSEWGATMKVQHLQLEILELGL